MVHLRPGYLCSVTCGMDLLTRLVASPHYGSERDFDLAARRFHDWDVCSVDCLGVAVESASPSAALGPSGRPYSADGRSSGLASARSPATSVRARITAEVCPRGAGR